MGQAEKFIKHGSRDYAFDDTSTSVSTREARGVSLVNRKFAVHATQKDAQLALQHFEADILKINAVLKSKDGQHTGHLEMAKLYISLDDREEAKKELAMAKQLMKEISELETTAMNMDSKSATTSSSALNMDSKSTTTSSLLHTTNDDKSGRISLLYKFNVIKSPATSDDDKQLNIIFDGS